MQQRHALLEVKDLTVAYGAIEAVKGIDLQVHEGELVCLIGSNGAGKSTTMKALTGLLTAQAQQITLDGQDLRRVNSWERVRHGLVMVPEGRGIFTRMTIVENLRMGAYLRRDSAQIQYDLQQVYDWFPRLQERQGQLAGTLSGGEQQMLAIGRALLSRPRLLLLDEPSMGLAPVMVDTIFSVIQSVVDSGVTVLLVEQNAARALRLAQRAYVMESGRITLHAPAQQLLQDAQVRAAYLGESLHD